LFRNRSPGLLFSDAIFACGSTVRLLDFSAGSLNHTLVTFPRESPAGRELSFPVRDREPVVWYATKGALTWDFFCWSPAVAATEGALRVSSCVLEQTHG
jgi:hypothetical protein